MGAGNETSDVIDVLGRRIGLLESVSEDAKDKRTLVENLELSRSTVDRGVRELETMGLLTYGDDGYEPEFCGRLAAEEYRRFERRIETLLEFQPFLKWISAEEFDLDLRWLADATLFTPVPGDPYAMVNRHVQLVKRAEKGRFLLPYVGQHATEAGYESVRRNGAEHELIVAPTVAETFRTSPAYADVFEDLSASDGIRVFVCEESFPYSLGVIDDEIVQITVDEDEEPRAMVETESPKVREWAEQKLAEYRAKSERVL